MARVLEQGGNVDMTPGVERVFVGPPWVIVVRAEWPQIEDGAFTTVIGPIVNEEEIRELLRNIGPAAKAYPLHTTAPGTVAIGFSSQEVMGSTMTTAVHTTTNDPFPAELVP